MYLFCSHDKRSMEAMQSGSTAGRSAGGGYASTGQHSLGGGYTVKVSDLTGGETGGFKDITGDYRALKCTSKCCCCHVHISFCKDASGF